MGTEKEIEPMHISEYGGYVYNQIMEGKWHANISKENNYFQNLNQIKQYYTRCEEEMRLHHAKSPFCMRRAYPCDWSLIFSPIEQDAWNSIRCKGRIPLYPQYPAGKYFIDFGNPFFKIGLELDGKEYHDPEKDKIRDTELYNLGWKIFRIPGREMARTNYQDWHMLSDEFWVESNYYNHNAIDLLEDWIIGTGDGVIEAIKVYFFKGHIELPEQYHEAFLGLCFKSLYIHNLVKNEI